MFLLWPALLGTVVILILTGLAVYLALTRDLIEIEFRSILASFRISGRGRR